MPLDALGLEVLFACGYSLIQPRLLTDDFFPRFRWLCLSLLLNRSTGPQYVSPPSMEADFEGPSPSQLTRRSFDLNLLFLG